ncbi:MAG: DNA polymerase III subunit gamma/tau [Bacteroidetes bacterium]|nr:DNA polymerase III subunit gamma/tau [Bacteroidota bacterium]
MENFVVSARKYRPVTFDTVVGQQSITSTLKNAIKNNHLAQAFLFCGPRGVGKTTCARILAKTINCENLTDNIEACDECESCTSFNNAASFNIHELDAASNNSVDDIRNLVDQVRIPPQVGKYKVYIIDEVHMLSASAFNAFLKTLEEPPAYAKFILATTEKHKIIPTILSRCQIFDFKRIGIDDIAKHLSFVAEKENVEAETDAMHIIAQKADGALRDALSIFDQIVSFSEANITYKNVIENLNVLDYDFYFKIVDSILNKDITQSLLIFNTIIENGFEGQHFIVGLAEHLRNLLVCKDQETLSLLEVGDTIRNRYADQSALCEVMSLIKSLEITSRCDIEYKTSNNKRLHVELALMQLCSLREKKEVNTNVPIAPPQKKTELQKPKPVVTEIKEHKKPEPVINEEKQPEKPIVSDKPVAKNPLPKIPGSISIKRNIRKSDEEENRSESNKPPKPIKNLDFNQKDLELHWTDYFNSISEKLPSFASALSKYKPELKEDFKIEFKIDNKIVANDKVNINNVQAYLKEHLQNSKLSLIPIMTEKGESNGAYTDQEKFEEMKKKNPNLKDLKEQLDLEIEF